MEDDEAEIDLYGGGTDPVDCLETLTPPFSLSSATARNSESSPVPQYLA